MVQGRSSKLWKIRAVNDIHVESICVLVNVQLLSRRHGVASKHLALLPKCTTPNCGVHKAEFFDAARKRPGHYYYSISTFRVVSLTRFGPAGEATLDTRLEPALNVCMSAGE